MREAVTREDILKVIAGIEIKSFNERYCGKLNELSRYKALEIIQCIINVFELYECPEDQAAEVIEILKKVGLINE